MGDLYKRQAFRRAQYIPAVKAYVDAWGEYGDEITGRYDNLEWPPYFINPRDGVPQLADFGF